MALYLARLELALRARASIRTPTPPPRPVSSRTQASSKSHPTWHTHTRKTRTTTSLLRLTRSVGVVAAGADVLRQVRDGYRRHRSERDGFAVAQLISGGRASLRELRALAAGADEAGPSDAYEVGTDWPWTADQSPQVPPKPLGLPRR